MDDDVKTVEAKKESVRPLIKDEYLEARDRRYAKAQRREVALATAIKVNTFEPSAKKLAKIAARFDKFLRTGK